MALLVFLCSLVLLVTTARSSAVVEKQTVLDDTNVDLCQQLLGRVEHLEKRDQDQQAEINSLRSELYIEKQRTSILEEVILSFRSQHSETSENDEKVTVDDRLPSNTDHRDSEKRHGQQSSTIVRRQAEVPVVAFHATLKTHQQHTGMHQSVAFENVFTNIGGAYNPHFGTFIAPVPGVYVFYTNILAAHNQVLHASVIKNGTMVAKLYVRDAESTYGQDSAMVVLHLAQGDDVAIQSIDSDMFINGYDYSMFSGFLLHEDVPTESIVG